MPGIKKVQPTERERLDTIKDDIARMNASHNNAYDMRNTLTTLLQQVKNAGQVVDPHSRKEMASLLHRIADQL